jgi:hypothetical protein
MITESDIYWITRFDYFQTGVLVVGAILVFLFTLLLVMACAEEEHRGKGAIALLCGILILIGGLFIPSTKEYCAIKVLPKIINDEQVQQMPKKVLDFADEWLEELRPEKEKK